MWIHSDVQITRRYRIHHVLDDAGTLVFSASNLGSVIQWLHEEGYSQAYLDDGNDNWSLTFQKRPG